MSDEIFSGVFGGLLVPSIGDFLGRFRYRTVFVSCFALSFIPLSLSVAYEYVSNIERAKRIFPADAWLLIVGLSLFFGLVGTFLKSLSPPLTWKRAETILLESGYVRSVSEDGAMVIFKKNDISFRARVSPGVDPSRMEWWKKGVRKGEVLLRTHAGAKQP